MSSQFYKTIIEDEINSFGIKINTLKVAAKSVLKSYSQNSLNKGNTFVDYNLPSNRCVYLYKYAPIHTSLVTKYFRTLLQKKQIKSTLKARETLKICCLGGGPGNDIVGIFKALALNPLYHKKVVEVTVLDICGGWRNSFKRVIASLVAGKLKDIPPKFFDVSNFKFKLIEVDLLKKLPANVETILSEADIVCMVKFVSAILGSAASFSAIEAIGKLWKVGAIIFFIDNFNGNVFKPLIETADQVGLEIVIGPLHIGFNPKNGFRNPPRTTAAEKETYGCLPCYATKVTVLTFLKTDILCNKSVTNEAAVASEIDTDNDDGWDTDKDSEEMSNERVPIHGNLLKLTVPKKRRKRNRNKKKKSTESTSKATTALQKKNSQLLKSVEKLTLSDNHSQTKILPKVAKDKKIKLTKTVKPQNSADNLPTLINAFSNISKSQSQSTNSLSKYSDDLFKLSADLSKNINFPQTTEILRNPLKNPNLNLSSPKKILQFPQEEALATSKDLYKLIVNSPNKILQFSQATEVKAKLPEDLSKSNVTSPKKSLQFPKAAKASTKTTANLQKSTEIISKANCDKYTQTYERYLSRGNSIDDIQASPSTSRELSQLVDSLSALVDVLGQWQQKRMQKTHCEHCHCH